MHHLNIKTHRLWTYLTDAAPQPKDASSLQLRQLKTALTLDLKMQHLCMTHHINLKMHVLRT